MNEPAMTRHTPTRQQKARKNREAALAAFIGKKAEIDAMLARLQALSDDHFNVGPDDVSWSQVGSLAHIAEKLRHVTAFAFGEDAPAE